MERSELHARKALLRNGGGNLDKATDPGSNLAYLGENPASCQAAFSKESNEEANDWTDLIELARIFAQTAVADLPAKLDQLIDVDSFLTALARFPTPATSIPPLSLASTYL